MADEKSIALAKQVYQTLCDSIDKASLHYEKVEEELIVHFVMSGEDIPMQYILVVDADRQLIRLLSPLPFNMSEDKRIEGALATCAASFGMADGNFDYNMADGAITFRMTASFRESLIGEGLFLYMIACANVTVDKYNDRFLALNKGLISISDFIAHA